MRMCLRFLLILCVLAPMCARGQSNYGLISGRVTDRQHLAIVGAEIEPTAASMGAVRRLVSNGQGLFEAPALLPDDYRVSVKKTGFASAEQRVRLEVGQKLALEISLTVGTLTQGVAVVAGSEVLRTTDASVGDVVEPESIRELPLNARMLIDLVLTVPGAHVSARKPARPTRSTGGRDTARRW